MTTSKPKASIRNATIFSAELEIQHESFLCVDLGLDYGYGSQHFGGFVLGKMNDTMKSGPEYMVHFVRRCLQITESNAISEMKGESIRVDADRAHVYGIGHLLKDDWFYPKKDFEEWIEDNG